MQKTVTTIERDVNGNMIKETVETFEHGEWNPESFPSQVELGDMLKDLRVALDRIACQLAEIRGFFSYRR